MLETVELRKVFKGKTVVDDVSLFLDRGESVGLLGPNGAGKSTTISMIASLLRPTEGDVRLNGRSVLKPRRSCAKCWASCRRKSPCTKS